jgi:hypothetical protein
MPVDPVGPLSGLRAIQAGWAGRGAGRDGAGRARDLTDEPDTADISEEGRRMAAQDPEVTLQLSPDELRQLVQGEGSETRS